MNKPDSSKTEPTDHISQVGKKVDVVANAKDLLHVAGLFGLEEMSGNQFKISCITCTIEALIERITEFEAEVGELKAKIIILTQDGTVYD